MANKLGDLNGVWLGVFKAYMPLSLLLWGAIAMMCHKNGERIARLEGASNVRRQGVATSSPYGLGLADGSGQFTIRDSSSIQ